LATEKLKGLRKPDLVILPVHQCTDELIGLIRHVFGDTPCFQARRGRLDDPIEQALRQLTSKSTVLLADDALIEGRTLKGLRHEVYRVCQPTQVPQIQAFVCIARPDSAETLTNAGRPLFDAAGRQLYAAYELFLPSRGEHDCPWCLEHRFWRRFVQSAESPIADLARKRIALLEGHDLHPPFILDCEEVDTSVRTRGSFFGELDIKTAFAAATCAALEIRATLETERNFRSVAVLDVPMVVSSYFDSVLIAAVFRTLTATEIFDPSRVHEVSRTLMASPTDAAYPGLLAEYAWAGINRKLPYEPLLRLLEAAGGSSDRTLLRQALIATRQLEERAGPI
jgi:hypothetical protein